MRWRMQRTPRPATRARVGRGFTLTLLLVGVVASPAEAGPPQDGAPPSKPAPVKLGLSVNDLKAFQGYTLLAPMTSTKTYLIDMHGRVVRTWESDSPPALSAYLLENGHLLRPCASRQQTFGFGPGAGGRVQEFDWDGGLVWDFQFATDKQLPHHDICPLPNGNVLLIAWEKKTAQEAVAAGRRPETVGENHLQPDCVLEVRPTGKTTGKVVWEWHAWDHLVQDFDKDKANYGDVGAHPELIDLNFGEGVLAAMIPKKEELEKLRAIGYVGSPSPGSRPQRINPDWTHINSVAYNAELDQILLSAHEFSEIWVIDHSTTTAEVAGHRGGRGGKGGDLLYRWGNPRAYRAGTVKDQKLFAQHHAHWIPRGHPGEGHILVFNNGVRRPGGAHSTVDEIVPPVDGQGRYAYTPGTACGPDKAVWTYAAPKRTDLYSMLISGAQRLPNGNTLICSGINGTLFEVTPEKQTVWKYVNPVKGGPMPGMPFGGPPQPGQLLPGFLQDMLKLTAEQKKQAGALQEDLSGKLNKLLTDEQRSELTKPQRGFGPGGFGGPPRPGEVLPRPVQDRLKLTDDQKQQVAALQQEADEALDKLLTEEQRMRVKEMQKGFGGPPGGPGGRPGRPPGPPGGPGGFGPPGGFGGPPGGGSVFRAYRYAANYPGLAGKDLTPGKTVEELQPKDAPKESKGD
jgi:Arylsulfotransferase (ASST)